MTPNELIAAACPKIGSIGGAFYFTPATLAKGKEHGLDGYRWYVLGRGGVLGDVEPAVVVAAFGYFAPALIDRLWSSAKAKLVPRDAGTRYMSCCADYGRATFAAVDDLDAFNAAATKIVDAIDPAGLSLYAGVAAEPRVDDAPGLAMQLAAVLREYRGSAHLLAVLASGLSAQTAHFIRRPNEYKTFGYTDDGPTVTDTERAKLDAADALTDQLVLPAFATLDGTEAKQFVSTLEAMEAAIAP